MQIPLIRIVCLSLLCYTHSNTGYGQEPESNGQLTVRRFDVEGKVRNVTEGSYTVSISDSKFCVRILNPAEFNDRGTLVISDYSTIYQSEFIYRKDNDPALSGEKNTLRAAHGFFDQGAMPNGSEAFGVVQGMALAAILTSRYEYCLKNGIFRSSLIPRIIFRRSRESNLSEIEVKISRDLAQRRARVEFWAGKKGTENKPNEESAAIPRILLALLETEWGEAQLPLITEFTLNSSTGRILSQVKYTGTITKNGASYILNAISYEDDMIVRVVDSRFPELPQFRYELGRGDVAPFLDKGNRTYQRIMEAKTAALARQDVNRKKQMTITVSLAAIFAAILGVAVKHLKTKKQK